MKQRQSLISSNNHWQESFMDVTQKHIVPISPCSAAVSWETGGERKFSFHMISGWLHVLHGNKKWIILGSKWTESIKTHPSLRLVVYVWHMRNPRYPGSQHWKRWEDSTGEKLPPSEKSVYVIAIAFMCNLRVHVRRVFFLIFFMNVSYLL